LPASNLGENLHSRVPEFSRTKAEFSLANTEFSLANTEFSLANTEFSRWNIVTSLNARG
jgi:hypothetical protein